MNTSKKYGGLIAWVTVTAVAGIFASFFDPGTWYQNLVKPSFTPPSWLFPVVWPVLYLLMAIAVWLIWKDYGFTEGRRPLKWFGVQLALNTAWSWIFFGRHNIAAGLAEISLLWIAILFTILLFWKRNRWAGYLMIPYLLWTTYALALNYAIWQLN